MPRALGKPDVTPLRSGDLRELQKVIANIRERLETAEAYLKPLVAASTASTASTSSSASTGLERIDTGLVAKRGSNIYAGRTIEVPAELEIANANGVNGNPTLSWAAQPANLVLASPDGSAGAPTFRALTADDISGGVLSNPMTEFGDLVYGQSAGSPSRLPIGTDGQFLTAVFGIPQWTSVAPGSGMGNPMLDFGDMIYGQSAGSPARLAPGSEGDVLTISSGIPTWAAPAPSGSFSSPMTDFGDLIFGQSSGSPSRLAIGTEGQVLKVVSGLPAWAAESAAGGSFSNPMTDYGDLIIGQSAGSPARLAPGSDGQVLTLASGLPSWATPSGGSGSAPLSPDTYPTTADAADDEFDTGSSIDTAGTRFSGATAWSWVNQGSATADLSAGHLVLVAPSSASDSNRILIQAASGSWKYRCKLATWNGGNSNFRFAGMCARNSSNGRLLVLKKAYSSGEKLEVDVWASPTSFSATRYSVNIYVDTTPFYSRSAKHPMWLEIESDGTNLYCRFSDCGVDGTFTLVYTEAIATYLGAVDGIGLVVANNNSAQSFGCYDWFRRIA